MGMLRENEMERGALSGETASNRVSRGPPELTAVCGQGWGSWRGSATEMRGEIRALKLCPGTSSSGSVALGLWLKPPTWGGLDRKGKGLESLF